MFRKINVRKNERAMLLRNGDFECFLQPGKHRVWSWLNTVSVQHFDLKHTRFNHEVADYLMAKEPQVVEQEFVQVALSDTQVGLQYENDSLVAILAPTTRCLLWKGLQNVRVEVIDISEDFRLSDKLVKTLAQPVLRNRSIDGTQGVELYEVPEFHVGVLRVDGQLQDLLPAGTYGFWLFNRNVQMEYVDLRAQHTEVSGQEILTKDKVSLRVNLSAIWRYVDVKQAFAQLPQPEAHVYRMLQFGLRAVIGTRTLDELLENKDTIDQSVLQYATSALEGVYIDMQSVGVKDIILPGEMKTILAQVVEAEKSAQANVIRRREETAATRSLLNTAKVMQDNPVALRMKELETLERVAERIDKISVVGGLDQVLNGLVKLKV